MLAADNSGAVRTLDPRVAGGAASAAVTLHRFKVCGGGGRRGGTPCLLCTSIDVGRITYYGTCASACQSKGGKHPAGPTSSRQARQSGEPSSLHRSSYFSEHGAEQDVATELMRPRVPPPLPPSPRHRAQINTVHIEPGAGLHVATAATDSVSVWDLRMVS